MSALHPLLSRKLWAAIVGVVFAGLSSQYPSLQPILGYLEAPILTYIAGQSIVDATAPKSDAAGGVK